MTDDIKWGLLSTARINRRLIPAINETEGSSVHAVASRTMKKSREYAESWGITDAYGNYDALLAADDIDVIYNSLPNHMHAEWTIRSLNAGKHVLCEKPMCLTLSELDAIEQASQASGKIAMEAFMYLHHPLLQVVKDVLRGGRIGGLQAMRSAFTFYFNRPADNYRMAKSSGGGSLWDVGVYPISLFQALTGSEPEKVSGIAIGEDIDIRFLGNMIYPNGVTGQFTSGFDAAYSNYTVLHCTEGYLTISHPFNNIENCQVILYQGDDSETLDVPRLPLYHQQVQNVNAVVGGLGTANIDIGTSRGHLRTVLRLFDSAAKNAQFT